MYFGGNLSLKNETENQNVIAKDPTFSKEDVTDEFLKIYFLDVGQADSTLIINNNQTMLIDAGNNEDGNLIVKFIKSLGIENRGEVEISAQKNAIMIKKYEPVDVFTGSDKDLIEYEGKLVSVASIEALAKLAGLI